MATWQGERFLPRQLASILGQTRLPDELVVVDDASFDASPEIVKSFAETAPFDVRLIRSDVQRGSTRSFGTGIEAATGDLIMLADQDDLWLPQKVARLEAVFQGSSGTTFAFTDALLIDEDDVAAPQTLWQSRRFSPALQAQVRRHPFRQLSHRFLATGCTMAFRADLARVVLPFPESVDEHADAMLHDRWISIVLSAPGHVAVVPEPLVAYRIHSSQQVGLANATTSQPPLRRYARRLALPQTTARNVRRYQLRHLHEARDRLEAAGVLDQATLADVDAVIAHQHLRCEMAGTRRSRLAPIGRELLQGNYREYSRGLSSAFIDLLGPVR
jgi:glycosyltransferase involved in cell wall biosynthesis